MFQEVALNTPFTILIEPPPPPHTHTPQLVRRMPIDDVVLLDVDESTMESPHVEDLEALPSEVVSELKHVLKKQASAYGDTVARSFLRAQVRNCSHGCACVVLKLKQYPQNILSM